MKQLRRYIQNNDGVMAIEAAIVLPVFITFVMGIIFLGHAIMVRQNMFYALDHAGRQAMVSSTASNTTLESTALGKMTGFDTANVIISATDSTVDSIDYKVLTASYTYDFPTIVGLSDVTMTANVTVPTN